MSEDVVRDMIARGVVTRDTLVWNPEYADRGWTRAGNSEISSLFGPPQSEPIAANPAPVHDFNAFTSFGNFPDYELATKGQRFLGALLDFVLMSVASMVSSLLVIVVFGIFGDARNLGGRGAISPPALILLVIVAVAPVLAFGIYNLYLLSKNRQSIGKKIMNTKIADTDGNSADMWRIILLRGLLFGIICSIPVVGVIVSIVDICFILFREDRRMLHDIIAGTMVIKI
jgi:uncharacterized RDD family membrane protein YckC